MGREIGPPTCLQPSNGMNTVVMSMKNADTFAASKKLVITTRMGTS